jgi:ABC-type Fe3+-hydroxamate transport system substrate-binding protein
MHTKNWREHLLLAAAFLDKSQEADEWLAVYDDKADRVCDQWNQINRKEKLLILMIDRQDCNLWEGGACGQMSRQHLPFLRSAIRFPGKASLRLFSISYYK